MAILAIGIGALVATVVIAAYGSDSWLCFWDYLGQAERDVKK